MAKVNEADLIGRVRKKLEQEPTINDPMNIDLLLEYRGGLLKKRPVLLVSGRIRNEAEGSKIEDSIRSALNDPEEVTIENNLVVPLV